LAECTLVVDGRVVLRAEGTTPEAEFALFDAGCCELQTGEPNREAGYKTTAREAKRRLALAGVTVARAREVARLLTEPTRMGPSLAERYARGQMLRLLARELDGAALLEGHVFNGGLKSYMGRWLNLHQLSRDINLAAATYVLQALYLAAALDDVSDDAPVALATSSIMDQRQAGERSWRRVALDQVVRIPGSLLKLANDPSPTLVTTGAGPSRSELLEAVRARLAGRVTGLALGKLSALERKLSARSRPSVGPLSDDRMWAIEDLLARGAFKVAQSELESLDPSTASTPATAYLRLRLALLTESEAADVLAQRAASLAQSSSDLPEAKWLAGQAWLAAGDAKKAQAFATLLLDDQAIGDDIRMLALDVLDACPPAIKPAPPSAASRSGRHQQKPLVLEPAAVVAVEAAPHTEREPAVAAAKEEDVATLTGPWAPPPLESTLDLPIEADGFEPFPAAERLVQSTIPSPPPEQPADAALEALAEFPSLAALRARTLVMDRAPTIKRADTVRIEPAPQPPGRAAERPPPIAAPPSLRAPSNPKAEVAESLSFPPGLHGHPPPAGERPRTIVDARLAFIYATRTLAREIRLGHGFSLKTTVKGLEQAQAHLSERFPEGHVWTPNDIVDVEKYGAFLSEMLARNLGATWVDIAPAEIGHWSMLVPPGVQVWPFGRILRFVLMGGEERNIVGYYKELEKRARGSE
jgi:hypothetical protein